MSIESRGFNQTVKTILSLDEGLFVNNYRNKDRRSPPRFDTTQKGLLVADFDDTLFDIHYKMFREEIRRTNTNPNIPLICARNYQLCSKSTERYNQVLWPLLDLYYYKRWGLDFDKVMEMASNAPLKKGVVELFHDLQATKRVEIAINSFGMKPFIERVLESHGLTGIHVMANPIVNEEEGQMGVDLQGEEFDPYDVTQWPSEPLTHVANEYIKDYPVLPATKGKTLRGLENKLGIDPSNTVVVGDSGGDVNMFRACEGLRIAQVNDREHFLRDPRLQTILKSTDLIALQPDGGFDLASQAIRERMLI